jgi:fructose-1,6-bisphosphatase I
MLSRLPDARSVATSPFTTVQQHILQEQQRFPGATGEFSWLLSGITLATKAIHAKVSRAGLTDILGTQGAMNVQGEQQQKLDVYANDALLHCLSFRESIGILASEENEEPILMCRGGKAAKYAVLFDPLDGSSNIDVNVSVGTIFSILRRPDDQPDASLDWVTQPGTQQMAAGYVIYGSSTMLVYTAGRGVHGFTLDPALGAYVLSHENMRMPAQGKYYSVNEAYRDEFPEEYVELFDHLRQGKLNDQKYGLRYIGSLVADFHRTLLKGGVFAYPPTIDHAEGKLRLLYEVNPIAFIAEQAGGYATDGRRRVLDVQPTSVHQRSALIVGGRVEMGEFERCRLRAEQRPAVVH